MNPEIITDMQNRITIVEQTISDALKSIKSIEIDHQGMLKSNVKIPPGIASKIAYDANGLILKGDKLLSSDIPIIQIDGVDGLRKILEGKLSKSDVDKVQRSGSNSSLKKGDKIAATGTKINYDENGLIISSADLGVDDIPIIPISHIANLQEELEIIKANTNHVVSDEDIPTINPGTFEKVTVGADGRVISGSNLSIDDIPMELITKINVLESQIPSLASQVTVDSLVHKLTDTLISNASITSGTYTKVTVDSNGLVIKGDKLTVKDLPKLSITDIDDLTKSLRDKANQSDLVILNDSVSSIVNSLDKIGDLTAIKNSLKTKAEDSEVKEISAKINNMQTVMDTLAEKIPNELIMEQLKQIQLELSTVAGRITVLETKIGLSDIYNKTE